MLRTIYVAAGFILVCYLFPWLTNPSVSLSLNAYDLAEWASLHPAVRDATPALLTSVLLRLPLVCLALLIAFTARRSLLPVLIVLVLTAALLPPPEFIKALDDPNYRQQAGLALFTLIGGALGLSGKLSRARHWIVAAIGLLGALASIIGLLQSYHLMRGFSLPTHVGLGGVFLALLFLVVAGAEAINQTG